MAALRSSARTGVVMTIFGLFAACSPQKEESSSNPVVDPGVTGSAPAPFPQGSGLGAGNQVVEPREFEPGSPEGIAAMQQLIERFWAEPDARAEILERLESDFYTSDLLPFLTQMIESGDPDLAHSAVALLSGNTSSAILPALSHCLQSEEEDLRLSAVQAATMVRGPEITSFLEVAFSDPSPNVRLAYLFDLEHHSNVQQLRISQTALEAPHQDVRSTAVGELEVMSSPRSVEVLMKALDSPHEELREEAAFSIDFLLGESFSSTAEAEEWWRINRRRFTSELIEID